MIERHIHSQVVRADCSEAYARATAHVLDEFEKLAHSGKPLQAGAEIRFGWTLFHLIQDGSNLLIAEPNFAAWPEERWNRTIDTSLEIIASQVQLLKRLGVDGADTYFDQSIIAVPGVLPQPNVFLRRDSSISAADSGWLLASIEDPEALSRETNLERIATASLVQRRRPLLQALTLPPGFIVVFSGDSIDQVFDGAGRELL